MAKIIPILLILGLILSGCYTYKAKSKELAQNWDTNDQKAFYQTSQGSQFLNYNWFLALEQPDNEKLFTENSLERFGYLTNRFTSENGYNPDSLPIGFVKDEGPGYFGNPKVFGTGDRKVPGPWIGFTCAACHTAEIEINGKPHLIDGAPADADFHAFIEELSQSLSATAADDARFDRFAAKVETRVAAGLADEAGVEFDKDKLRNDLRQIEETFATFVKHNTPVYPWGRARMDAVGLILNEVTYKLVPTEENIQVPNAPVSFPFLWETHQQPQVQWNGVSVATLSRNTTEVLGAFATFNPQKPKENSVDFKGLKNLQVLVVNLRSPRWKDNRFELPKLDKKRLKSGEKLYDDFCTKCHAVSPRDEDPAWELKIELNTLDKIGTDPTMARNFVKRKVITKDWEEVAATTAIFSALNAVWSKSHFGAWVPGIAEELRGQLHKKLDRTLPQHFNVYKARPLNGAWTTGPFLHNGSVKNIYQIMLPADERDPKFCVGRRELDTEHLGFNSDLSSCEDAGGFILDTSLPGNSNKGHEGPEYGTDQLDHEARMDIIEFIKSE